MEEVPMNNTSYRFNVGDFQCFAVSDGFHAYTPPNFPPPQVLLFSNAPEESLKTSLERHGVASPWPEWVSPYTCLVVNTGKQLVLVDTGAGDLAPTTGKLIENLRAEGIRPGEIYTVINTHGHPDHLGGNTDANGKPLFPNARYVVSTVEWDFWSSGEAEKKLDKHSGPVLTQYAQKNLLQIKGRVDLISQDAEIVPGIRAIPAPGHTPGLVALSISSKNEQLLYLSDVIIHPVHLEHTGWCCVFDVVPRIVQSTRRRLLGKASREKALVMAFHFPFPGLGHVIPEGKVWRWEAAKISI
jgi:glyoxylase-like metal-dependent hydrolase (beta-lactamase superfamily II)